MFIIKKHPSMSNKSFLVLAVFLFITLSCKKTTNKPQAKPAFAGHYDSTMNYYRYPTPFILPEWQAIPDTDSTRPPITPGYLNIDLNGDQINDITIARLWPNFISQVVGNYYDYPYAKEPILGTMAQPLHTNISLQKMPVAPGALIDHSGDWSDIGMKNLLLSHKTYQPFPQPEVMYNPWANQEKFLAVRMLHDKDTVYGWVGLQIEDYDSVRVFGWAMSK
jgi:hypothetical protein